MHPVTKAILASWQRHGSRFLGDLAHFQLQEAQGIIIWNPNANRHIRNLEEGGRVGKLSENVAIYSMYVQYV